VLVNFFHSLKKVGKKAKKGRGAGVEEVKTCVFGKIDWGLGG